jgi:Mg-chelatase subunit ChlD
VKSPVRPLLAIALLCAIAPGARAEKGRLELEIQSPTSRSVLPSSERWIEVEGGASTIGGVRELDLFFVMDTSSSLRSSDPDDARTAGAIGLVESLPARSNTRIGVVEFDKRPELVLPLTSDRRAAVEALRGLDQSGSTDLAAGIRKALAGFEKGARPGASRVMLVFSDGETRSRKANAAIRRAVEQARQQGIAVHALSLGSSARGGETLAEIAESTGGSFIRVTDPARLPQAFLDLRTTGVDHVTVRVNDSAPVTARLRGSRWSARVPVTPGENRIVATATSLRGATRSDSVNVNVRDAGCAALQVEAQSDGQPALAISDRAVEIVFDASRSMWGRMEGRPKMAVAKEILDDALDWMPPDLDVSLRAYGHQHPSEQRDCQDTQLLVPLAKGNREPIREAVDGLRPAGQTPIGYALSQVDRDLGRFEGERAVVLVTDGIESCGRDPVAAARALQANGPIPVHVIGFGLASEADEDVSSLRGIAEASGGRFLTARSAGELRDALSTMVGTTWRVWRGDTPVAESALGSPAPIRLPAGDYLVRLESAPPQELPVTLADEEQLKLVFRRDARELSYSEERAGAEYAACEAPTMTLADVPERERPGVGVRPNQVAARRPGAPGPDARAASPAAPAPSLDAPRAQGSKAAAPRARKLSSLTIPDGSVEIWQNLRPDRREDFGVVLRHPGANGGSEMVWSGNDLERARSTARRVQSEMQRVGSLPRSPGR